MFRHLQAEKIAKMPIFLQEDIRVCLDNEELGPARSAKKLLVSRIRVLTV